eukprot:evm.model.scf_4366.1 EVM.evm.TU.scf_4366.1   scf_4366:533-3379(+)
MSTGGDYGVNLIPLNAEQFGVPLGGEQRGLGLPAPAVAVQKPAKSVLHEFYQQHRGTPVFTIVSSAQPPAEPCFKCSLECPGLDTLSGISCPTQTFDGEARSKRAAEHAAAKKALDYFRSLGLLPAEVEGYNRQQQQQQQQQQMQMQAPQVVAMNPLPVFTPFGRGGVYGADAHQAANVIPLDRTRAPLQLMVGVGPDGQLIAGGGGIQEVEALTADLEGITLQELKERYKLVVQENSSLRQELSEVSQTLSDVLQRVQIRLQSSAVPAQQGKYQ